MNFDIYTLDSAPDGSKPSLNKLIEKHGKIQNHFGVMAESPVMLNGYLSLHHHFDNSTFTNIEKQLVMFVISYENNCDYCVAAHSTYLKANKLPEGSLNSLRKGQPLNDQKLEKLKEFTLRMVRKKGWVNDDDLNEFISVGYTKENVFEIISGIALKTMSNYVNHISNTPLDKRYARFKWQKNEENEV